MQPRATQLHIPTRDTEHRCRPGWRQATFDGHVKPVYIPPTRMSSPPGTRWVCSCDRVWIAWLRLSEMAEPDGPIRWRRERPWERWRRNRATLNRR